MPNGEGVLERICRLEERLLSLEKKTETSIKTQEDAVAAALHASEKAMLKAEVSGEKRLDSVNEFRGQLKDQAATFIVRAEYEQAHRNLIDKTSDIFSRMDKLEGSNQGIGISWGVLLSIIGVIAIMIDILMRK